MSGKYPLLLTPGNIGVLKLKNRVIFSPCETLYATSEGEVTQRLIDYYVRRAEGGAGLLVVHSAVACTKMDPIDPFAHSLRVDDNTYLPMLSELTDAVHRAGAKIAILVSAGGGAQAMGFPYDRGQEGIVEMRNVGVGDRVAAVAQRPIRVLTVEEIKKIIVQYGLAARRVMLAGFDALYVHALNYLIGQFISPLYNTRDDEYGGDFDRRMRFFAELMAECRKHVGPRYPIVVRMSIDECFPGGRGVEESIRVIERMKAAGVDAIDASAGIYESMHMIIPPIYLPKGVLTDFAAAVKRGVDIPVITQGRLYDPELNEAVLQDGKADFIGMARGLLADPEWVNKVAQGRENEIRRCITCNQCIDRILKSLSIRCAINPTAGREWEFAETPSRAKVTKRVAIVGGGPAGMETARIAALKGHSVKLYEKSAELGGGQYKLAASAPYKEEFNNLLQYYDSQFQKLDNLEIVFNKEVLLEDLLAERPDVVVLATGAEALVPKIEGLDRPNVFTNHDQLLWAGKLSGKVVIVGGGCAGAGTADKLSEQGLDVTVVEMLAECALDEELITRLTLMHRFSEKQNVRIMTNHTVRRITGEGVLAISCDGREVLIPADYVIVAFGAVPYNPLEEEVRKKINEVYVIGDAVQPKKIRDAVADGFLIGQKI